MANPSSSKRDTDVSLNVHNTCAESWNAINRSIITQPVDGVGGGHINLHSSQNSSLRGDYV
jgi:hypothetical protein